MIMLSGEKIVGVYNGVQSDIETRDIFPHGEAGTNAFVQWWNETNCLVLATAASGFRSIGLESLANVQTAAGIRGGCNEDGLFIALDKQLPEGSWTGGQCDFYYVGTIDRQFQNNPSLPFEIGLPGILGPIEEIRPNPNGSGSYSVEYRTRGSANYIPVPGGGTVSSINPIIGINGVALVPRDGQQDVCGDNPLFVSEYEVPPNEPAPPQVGDIVVPSQDVTIQYDYGEGLQPVTFEFADLVFAGARGLIGAINGIPFRLGPDGVITSSEPGDTDGLASTPEEEVLDKLEEELDEPIDGEIVVPICNDEPLTTPYMGEGLEGIRELILASTLSIASQIDAICQCQSGAVQLSPRTQLTQGEVGPGEVIIFPLPDKSVIVELEVSGNDNAVRVMKLAGDNSEGKYGFISFGNDVQGLQTFYSPFNVFFRKTSYAVSGFDRPVNRVRLSLTRGLSYNLFVITEVD